MIVISSRTFRDNLKKYLDLSRTERVIIKRKDEFLELIPRGSSIPENISPSNDVYFDNELNVSKLQERITDYKSGKAKGATVKSKEELHNFLENI